METPEQAARRKLANDLNKVEEQVPQSVLQMLAIEYKEILAGAGERLSTREHRLINGFVDYMITVEAAKGATEDAGAIRVGL